jgi:predicted RNA binding protein YcfA (HicA-like mRNA interferase family)
MKRSELLKILSKLGCQLVRNGGKHDWYQNKISGACQPIPRHKEINENLAKSIIKKLS